MTPTSLLSGMQILMLVAGVANLALLFIVATHERRRPVRVEFRNLQREYQLELATGGGLLLLSAMLGSVVAEGEVLANIRFLAPFLVMLSLLCINPGFHSVAPRHGVAADGLLLGRFVALKHIDGWEWQGERLVVREKGHKRYDYPFDTTSRPRVEAALQRVCDQVGTPIAPQSMTKG